MKNMQRVLPVHDALKQTVMEKRVRYGNPCSVWQRVITICQRITPIYCRLISGHDAFDRAFNSEDKAAVSIERFPAGRVSSLSRSAIKTFVRIPNEPVAPGDAVISSQ
ncbi:hypothetical protein EYD00_13980 [Agrobacterium sp. 33MFTa1.1]|nr:hypothetical protein EYD00_13980 [Agrobacterium sp. 33MFTa1.1]